jgi:hypothetical protein
VSARRQRLVARVLAVGLFLVVANAAGASWGIGLAASSAAEAAAGTAPAIPGGVTAACTAPTGSTVTVTWSAVPRATSYTIWMSMTSATSGYSVAATGVTGTSWTSGSLATGNYWFEVSSATGTNWASGRSAASAQRTILVTACV